MHTTFNFLIQLNLAVIEDQNNKYDNPQTGEDFEELIPKKKKYYEIYPSQWFLILLIIIFSLFIINNTVKYLMRGLS